MVIKVVMGKIKEIVKTPFLKKQNSRYEGALDRQYISYHQWITRIESKKRKEELEKVGVNNHLSAWKNPSVKVEVIPYKDCGNITSFTDKNVDIFLFTRNQENLSKDCIEIVKNYFAENLETMILYGDEDEWNNTETARMNPWLKPDWSPDTLQSFFYFGNVVAVRKNLFDRVLCSMPAIGGISLDWQVSLYHFFLQATLFCNDLPKKKIFSEESELRQESSLVSPSRLVSERIAHVPEMLYHSHKIEIFGTDEKFSQIKEVAYLKYRKEEVSGDYNQPCVSIIIPSKDNPITLEMCLSSIYQNNTDLLKEIIVVDNGSTLENQKKLNLLQQKYAFDYYLEERPFNFSYMCNKGADLAKGEVLLFLNDDIEIKQENWLTLLVEKVRLPYVGGVGAKLLYPNSSMIQHVGITNLKLGPVHKMQYLSDDVKDSYYRNLVPYNVIGVTGAALMIKKKIFDKVGGFLEELEVAFNDVEFCFRLYKEGYHNVVRNDVTLWHYESFSRGDDGSREKLERLHREKDKLYDLYPELYGKDPYYHKYYSQSILDTRFSYLYQYEEENSTLESEIESFTKEMPPHWENSCLKVSLEYAGDWGKWNFEKNKSRKKFFQGFAFVIGSDNSCYQRSILLKNIDTGVSKKVLLNSCYRPDIEVGLADQIRTTLSGFSVVVDMSPIEIGEYQVGVLAEDRCSRQKLVTWTNHYITS